jgi:hypothetical protein
MTMNPSLLAFSVTGARLFDSNRVALDIGLNRTLACPALGFRA